LAIARYVAFCITICIRTYHRASQSHSQASSKHQVVEIGQERLPKHRADCSNHTPTTDILKYHSSTDHQQAINPIIQSPKRSVFSEYHPQQLSVRSSARHVHVISGYPAGNKAENNHHQSQRFSNTQARRSIGQQHATSVRPKLCFDLQAESLAIPCQELEDPDRITYSFRKVSAKPSAD
jgi:hypothetical protein